MLCTAELDMADSITPDDVDVFLDSTAWAICSTYHMVLKASPGAAIFGCNMLFDIPFVADWHKIGEQRQSLTNRGNQHKNAKHIDYNYKVRDKVLLINEGILCKADSSCDKEPWTITTQMELSGFNTKPERNDFVSGEYNHLQMTFYKLGKNIHQDHKFYYVFSYFCKILCFFDSNTVLTSSMTSRIMRLIFSISRFFLHNFHV
jgi:hypothetical protein